VKHFKEGDRLIGQQGLTRHIRPLDALQLAVALDLQRRGMVDQLASSDGHLLAVAVVEGIPVLDPENSDLVTDQNNKPRQRERPTGLRYATGPAECASQVLSN
jgi:hypothetical protein